MRTILIADPLEAIRLICKSSISRVLSDSEFVFAENGSEAFDKIVDGGIDLAIIEFDMAVINGSDLMKAIKRIKSDIPVIMFSSHANNPDKKEEFKKLGFVAILKKPCGVRQIVDATLEALQERVM